jgi:hypothetical protein
MEEQKQQVYDFVGAITCLSAGEQVKVLADVVGALLIHDGHMEQALLYVQSQIPDKTLAAEQQRLREEELLAFKKAGLKVSPLLERKKGQSLELQSPADREKQEQQERDRQAQLGQTIEPHPEEGR